jgi:DNA-binding NarL/FixJ family response regulator
MIIEDDKNFIDCLIEYFEDDKDYQIEGYTTSNEALKKLKTSHYDVILLDYFLDNENGEKVLQKIRILNQNIFVSFLTGYSKKITSYKAFELGVQGYIEKTGEYNQMINSIKTLTYSSIKAQEFLKKDNKVLFRSRLKLLREKHGMSQNELATLLGLSRTSISNYEIGNAEPSLTILSKIATILNTSTDYLIGRLD